MLNRTIITKDLLAAFEEDGITAIGHCANCYNTMGSGVALAIRKQYPEAAEADAKTTRGDSMKMGTFSFAKLSDGRMIFNLYGQYTYSSKDRELQYDDMICALEAVRDKLEKEKPNSILAFPYKMGCDRAGGHWPALFELIDTIFSKSSIEVRIYQLP